MASFGCQLHGDECLSDTSSDETKSRTVAGLLFIDMNNAPDQCGV